MMKSPDRNSPQMNFNLTEKQCKDLTLDFLSFGAPAGKQLDKKLLKKVEEKTLSFNKKHEITLASMGIEILLDNLNKIGPDDEVFCRYLINFRIKDNNQFISFLESIPKAFLKKNDWLQKTVELIWDRLDFRLNEANTSTDSTDSMLDFYQDKEKILKAFEKLGDEDIYKKVIETRNAITHGYFKEYADYSVGLFYKYNISGQGLENLIESDEDFLEDAKFIAGSVLPLLTEISKKVGAIKDGFFFRELGRYLNLLQGYAFRVEDVMIGPDYEEFRGKLIEEVNDVIKLIEEVEKKFAKEISEMNIIGIDEITTGSPKSLKQLCQEIRVSLGLDEE